MNADVIQTISQYEGAPWHVLRDVVTIADTYICGNVSVIIERGMAAVTWEVTPRDSALAGAAGVYRTVETEGARVRIGSQGWAARMAAALARAEHAMREAAADMGDRLEQTAARLRVFHEAFEAISVHGVQLTAPGLISMHPTAEIDHLTERKVYIRGVELKARYWPSEHKASVEIDARALPFEAAERLTRALARAIEEVTAS